MRKWRTNCKDLQDKFNSEERVIEFPNSEGKVLGYIWNFDDGTLELHLHNNFDGSNREDGKNTKRDLIRMASKIFDPCGYLSPFTIRSKILLQNIWAKKLKWDDSLPDDDKEQWDKWYSEMND